VSLNAQTGQTLLDKVIDRYHAGFDSDVMPPAANVNLSVRPATDTAIAVSDYTAGAANPYGWRAVNVTTGDSVWITDPVPFRGNPGRDALTEVQGTGGSAFAMRREPDLLVRCVLAQPPRTDQPVACSVNRSSPC
jgi:hypothetical protein